MQWSMSDTWWKVELSNLYHCVQQPWKVIGREFWSSRYERKPVCHEKCVLRKYCGVCQKWWMLELSNLCHCVQHPWKLTHRDYWSSRNERKSLCQLKYVLRKYSGGFSGTWWMLEVSNLCHCVQHPCKVSGRNFRSSRNKRKPLFQQKMCFEKMLWGMSEMVNARAFKPVLLCSALPENLLVSFTGALRNDKKATFSAKTCVLRKSCGVWQKWWMLELANLCHCVQYPWKLTHRDYWSSKYMKESHFFSKNVFWENTVGYVRNGDC